MDTLPLILAIVTGAIFVLSGTPKILSVPFSVQQAEHLQLTPTLRLAIGVIEVIIGALLLIGAIAGSSGLAVVGAIGGVIAMVLATVAHVRAGDGPPMLVPPVVVGILSLLVLILA